MIYLDNAATTVCLPCSVDTMTDVLKNCAGNPSSLHKSGFDAEQRLKAARETVASAMGISAEELLFTPGGSASDNLAIRGFAAGKKRGRFITSAYEHPAVLECFKALETSFDVVYLRPENGIITPDILARELTDDTVFVSIMHVNNETGAVNPIRDLAKTLKRRVPDAVFHTDSVQGFLKEDFNYSCVDMASFSAHKTHAPRGIGGLYVKKGVKLKPLIYGGGQEKGLCCGTENVAGAAAWAAAVAQLRPTLAEDRKRVAALRERMKNGLEALGAKEISPAGATPFILNTVFEGYLSENILHYLSSREIYVSTGSACSSKKSSAVFRALGLENYGKSALRISFSHLNTEQDVDTAVSAVKDALDALIKLK